MKRILSSNPARFASMWDELEPQCPYLNEKGQQAELPLDLTPAIPTPTVFAEMAGYVTVNADGAGYWKVLLTDSGKKVFQESGSKHLSNAPAEWL